MTRINRRNYLHPATKADTVLLVGSLVAAVVIAEILALSWVLGGP